MYERRPAQRHFRRVARRRRYSCLCCVKKEFIEEDGKLVGQEMKGN